MFCMTRHKNEAGLIKETCATGYAGGIQNIPRNKKMIIIAFAEKTSKILPRILCGKIKHCAPIEMTSDNLIMHQFISRGNIAQIKLNMRDIKILTAHGWRFVYLPCDTPRDLDTCRAWTCVQFCKYAIGMRNIFIQTPNELFKAVSG